MLDYKYSNNRQKIQKSNRKKAVFFPFVAITTAISTKNNTLTHFKGGATHLHVKTANFAKN